VSLAEWKLKNGCRTASAHVVAIVSLTLACGTTEHGTARTTRTATEPVAAQQTDHPRPLLLSCEAAPWARFGPAALHRPSGYERRSGPAAVELRRSSKAFAEDGGLPTKGWYLLARGRDRLLFSSGRGTWVASLTLRRQHGRWHFEMSGRCQPRAVQAGIVATSILLANKPDGSQLIKLLVDAPGCDYADGIPKSELVGPFVWFGAKTASIVVFVKFPNGPQVCGETGPTPLEVTLPEPLGQRELLDGGAVSPKRLAVAERPPPIPTP
jgi:hypothetical protein